MSKKLEGKVAVVTGASKGIGAEIARQLAAAGAAVVVNYASSKAGADKVVADITGKGGKAVAVKGDVSKAAEAQGIIDAAVKNYGRLDILVNNSGVYEFAPTVSLTVTRVDGQIYAQLTPTPEPSSLGLGLVGSGLGFAAALRRKLVRRD